MSTNHSSPETEPALKPCPFCGRPGAICCLEDEPGSPASFWVNCSCGMETRERRTEAEAIALWNTRAAPAQQPASPESARLADWLAHYATCFIDDERVGRRMLEIVAVLRAPAVWPTGTGNTPQDVQLTSLVTRPVRGRPAVTPDCAGSETVMRPEGGDAND